ncbi:hypothetical protein GCM10022240_29270 [Microbacterium kribbense]|uniref:HTH luxR-type domain-containing protein n=1 Tax=Microbacterium kribbense TaxID=433645 RepID=A0ABP7GVQ5_9MICO
MRPTAPSAPYRHPSEVPLTEVGVLLEDLTDREREVFLAIAEGLCHGEIAQRLF